ncbi:hypothetical protein TNCV_1719181 [Trichonephila clavipes]|nr:hypothetical protein TNCV_1719181 [Trichonephila clavipes]
MSRNRKVGMLTSRRRRQLSNFFTDMTQVMRSVPDPPFSYLLSMAKIRGDGGGDYFHSLFHCYTKLGNFLIQSRAQKSFTSKMNQRSSVGDVSLLVVTSQISAKALHLGDAANPRATVE